MLVTNYIDAKAFKFSILIVECEFLIGCQLLLNYNNTITVCHAHDENHNLMMMAVW